VAEEVVNDGRFDLVIVDEANAYKTITTKRWKSLAIDPEPQHIPVDDDRNACLTVTCGCVRLGKISQP
jgi:hypothetical protein